MYDYLTEKLLGQFLEEAFPGHEFVYNKTVPRSYIKGRPDYRCDKLKLIVEFDGYRHYSNCATIIQDMQKDITYSSLGYEVIRIPYFVQLDYTIVKLLFAKYRPAIVEFSTYPHGFIDAKAMQPYDYCTAGLSRFKKDMQRFECIAEQIMGTINCNTITSLDNYAQQLLNEFLLKFLSNICKSQNSD